MTLKGDFLANNKIFWESVTLICKWRGNRNHWSIHNDIIDCCSGSGPKEHQQTVLALDTSPEPRLVRRTAVCLLNPLCVVPYCVTAGWEVWQSKIPSCKKGEQVKIISVEYSGICCLVLLVASLSGLARVEWQLAHWELSMEMVTHEQYWISQHQKGCLGALVIQNCSQVSRHAFEGFLETCRASLKKNAFW